ncbi:MAG: YDG domain-containing protein [Treponema sp.]|jgi:formylglycine-generating enzyme required for sulfatase activity|nr:YDG domain-containing protein [Treponema sp.]
MKKIALILFLATLICVCFTVCDFENPIIKTWWQEQDSENDNPAIPVIITHPRSATYFLGTPAEDLTVTATTGNGEILSYQWYTNDKDDNMGGILIPGATEENYTPCTDYEGITYYYVVVTNMIVDNNGTGNISANVISNTAEIEVDATFAIVTVTGLSVQDKVYDGTTTAVITGTLVLNGVRTGDDVTLVKGTAEFTDAAAGINKSVILTGWLLAGADAGKYTLQIPNLTANITTGTASITVTITGLSAQNKTHDGTTAASVTGTPVLNGIVGGDDVTLVKGTAEFADATVGINKSIIFIGWSLAGADAGKYILQMPILTANINASPVITTVTVTGLSVHDKIYDGTTAATTIGTPVLIGVASGDNVTLVKGTAEFADAAVGINKSIILTGWSLAGASAGKYILQMPILTANIIASPAIITITGLSVQNKLYDGTTTATITGTPVLNGIVGSDNVTLVTGTAEFADTAVGINKNIIFNGWSLAGTDAGKYTLQMPSLTASITTVVPTTVTVTGLSVQTKTYDSTTNAVITGTPVLSGVASGDDVTLLPGLAIFTNPQSADNKDIIYLGWSLTGADAHKYILQLPALKGKITPKPLNITGLSVKGKVYDGTTATTIIGTPVLNGLIFADEITLITENAHFADASIGYDKDVTYDGYFIGRSAHNYTPVLPALTGDIVGGIVTITGLTPENKYYDGTTTATVNGTPVLEGVATGDDVTLVIGTVDFEDVNYRFTNVGIIFNGWSLAGADAGKYTLETPDFGARIFKRTFTVTGLSVEDKIYDGTTAATIIGTPILHDVLDGDEIEFYYAYPSTFNDPNVGVNKAITFGGSYRGKDSDNYGMGMKNLTGTIHRADPDVTWPSGLTASVGQELSEINLPGNSPGKPSGTFKWAYPSDKVGSVGTQYHSMTFITDDRSNYNLIDQKVAVVVTVTSIKMVLIPGGTFMMGSPDSEPDRFSNEGPQHLVTLSPFYMAEHLVTLEQFEAVAKQMITSSPVPGESGTPEKLPWNGMSWYGALTLCNELSRLEGLSQAYSIKGGTTLAYWQTLPLSEWEKAEIVPGSNGYRLPTEAQWEYACRAGTTTIYNTGDILTDDTGWHNGINGGITHQVGIKPPNVWGLYDMHGNVWEWCWDRYYDYPSTPQTDPTGGTTSLTHIFRGGGIYDPSLTGDVYEQCRSATRGLGTAWAKNGIRLVRPY